jgi:hypothetical protein
MPDSRRLVLSVIVAGMLVGTAALSAAEFVGPGRAAPELAAGAWVNSEPLTLQKLRGRVVLVEFWTYG